MNLNLTHSCHHSASLSSAATLQATSSTAVPIFRFLLVLNHNLPSSLALSLLFSPPLLCSNLASNKLNGSVPVFDGFPALTYLGLGGNSLQGTFPVTGNQALPLKTLDLRGNKLTGSIPRSISSLSSLEHLLLSENRFNGFIPDSIMNL
ncbi:unnamed protein product, partial [Closterium sp. NIES-54]